MASQNPNGSPFQPPFDPRWLDVRHWPLLRGIPHHDAEDLIQEAARRYHEALARSTSSSVPGGKALFHHILRACVADYHRRNARRPCLEALRQDLPSPELGPMEALVGQERINGVRQILDRLCPAERELLDAALTEGSSLVDYAHHLGIHPATLRSRWFRLRRRLRGRLDHLEEN